ncbi:hypothetical protein GJ744_000971 [Endocarpon pusillum]|uniref:Protein kinase domain-containing protein n=1 Tax=Endocarpon pusillum TaxID=364733 RepID=A0A8H7AA64_9EURO|nr:hypothetical protein GJ744_000971 [Endocarpon pusillum]
MAEVLGADLVILIARDVYLVAKWTYETVSVAQRHSEHLTQLQERLQAQVGIIAGFTHLFLTNLPPNDPDTRFWLPDVRQKLRKLQDLFAGGWTRLALKYDHDYREFNEIYTKGVESGEGQFVPPSYQNQDQWLIKGVSHSDSAEQSSSNLISGPSTRTNNLRTSDNQETDHFRFSRWKNSFKDKYTRYKFAAWDKKRIETTLTQMEEITDGLKRLTGLVTLHHPKYSPHKTQKVLRETLDHILVSPSMHHAADRIGLINHANIQQVIELSDDDASAEEHQNRLDGIRISVSDLSGASLEPEQCKKLSAGSMKDTKGTKHDVLIEYKGWASDDQDFIVERRRDIQILLHVLALAQPPFYPNLLSLRGYVDEEADQRYAFVFDYPPDSLHEQPLSLQDIIKSGTSVKGGANLENRFKVALQLAKSVAALHTVGWVHESICSDSVIIFKDAESKVVYEKPYLVNFEFSRPAGSGTSYASAAVEDRRLYQHPDRLIPSPPKYTKKHDLFSLGVVLLEIGLWKTTRMMCDAKGSRSADGNTTRTLCEPRDVYLALAKEDLGGRMGEGYQEAVISLLSETTASYGSNSGASVEMIKKVINACPRFDPS